MWHFLDTWSEREGLDEELIELHSCTTLVHAVCTWTAAASVRMSLADRLFAAEVRGCGTARPQLAAIVTTRVRDRAVRLAGRSMHSPDNSCAFEVPEALVPNTQTGASPLATLVGRIVGRLGSDK